MDNYISYPPPATGLACFGYPRSNGQEQSYKEWFGPSGLDARPTSPRPLTPSEVEEFQRRQARCVQEASGSGSQEQSYKEWFGPSGLDARPISPRPLTLSEVEEFHRRQARCVQEANGSGTLPASSRPLTLLEIEELRGLQARHAQEVNGSGSRPVSSRPMTLLEMEESQRREARCYQEANGSWFRPEQGRLTTIGGFTDLHQGTIPGVKADNGHGNFHLQSLKEHYQYLQRTRPNAPNLEVEDCGQRECLEARCARREYPRCDSAEEAWELDRGFQQYCKQQPVVQQAAPLISYPAPSNYLSSQALLNARIRQETEQRKFAQQKHDEQKREQEKAQLPAAKPGTLYQRPSRMYDPVRAVHEDGMERRTMSNPTFSTQPKSRVTYPEACRMFHDKLARKKEEERRKAAVSVPTPEPTRTESVKHLLSSVNKALEQKVEAAELQAADTECSESEILRIRAQQLQQDQNDATRAARQCGESFWYEYSANYPMGGYSRMKSQCSQKSDSASVQPLVAAPGHLKGSRVENPQETVAYHPVTEAIDKVPGNLVKSPRTQDPSSLERPVVSTSGNRGKYAAGGPRVPLASHKDASVNVSENHVSSLPIPREKETNVGPEVRADGKNVEALGDDRDSEAEWEEVDDDFGDGDEGWSDVDEEYARMESADVEWASEGAFDY